MEMKDLIFFIICSSLILLGIFVCIGCMVHEYITDYVDDREQSIFSYIGWGLAFIALVEVCVMLVVLLLSLFFSIDSYSLSYLGKFLKSEVFVTIVLTLVIGFVIFVYFVSKNYSFVDVMHYRSIRYKLKGVKKALEHSETSLKDIEKEIDKATKNGMPNKVIKELQDNRVSLAKDNENYLVKYRHLESIKVKLAAKIKENNIDI